VEPSALDAAFRQVLADVSALLRKGDVIAIDGKSLRGASFRRYKDKCLHSRPN
jgi:hypothetical protein